MDKWYVTDGLNAVGPVRLDLLSRGIETGRIPLDTFVRNESWKVWRPLSDFTEGQPEASDRADFLRAFDELEMTGPIESDLAPITPAFGALEDEDLASDVSGVIPNALLANADSGSRIAPPPSASRPAMTLPSDGVATLSSPPRLSIPHDVPHAAPSVSELVTSHESIDLLGPQRLTLASYLDDEETNVATQRPFGPPIVLDAPKPAPDRISSGRGARTLSDRPPPQQSQHQGPVIPSRPITIPPRPISGAPPRSTPPRPRMDSSVRLDSSIPRPVSRPVTPSGVPGSMHGVPGSMHGTADFPDGDRTAEALVEPTRSSLRPAPLGELSTPGWTPEQELSGAKDLGEALLLLLHAVVQRTPADIALVHRMSDDGAMVVCAHGPNAPDLLGTRVRLLDPAIVAAAGGSLVIAEPAPGPAGDATLTRLSKLGRQVEGGVMIPLRPRGRLLAILEMGKAERFHLRSIVRAEDLARAFVAKAEAAGWT